MEQLDGDPSLGRRIDRLVDDAHSAGAQAAAEQVLAAEQAAGQLAAVTRAFTGAVAGEGVLVGLGGGDAVDGRLRPRPGEQLLALGAAARVARHLFGLGVPERTFYVGVDEGFAWTIFRLRGRTTRHNLASYRVDGRSAALSRRAL